MTAAHAPGDHHHPGGTSEPRRVPQPSGELPLPPPAEPGGGRGPRSMQLVRRTRAERHARTGDLLQITKALLIRER